MKRSLEVSAPLLAAMALSLTTGCKKPEMQRCVDEQNKVVADSFCQNPQAAQRPVGTIGYLPVYRYYYGGMGGYAIGTPVTGGSYSALSGHSYATSTSRGGFGSSFGGGEGGGHGGGGGE
jgi:hypothetical protein